MPSSFPDGGPPWIEDRRGTREGRRIRIMGTVQGVGFRPWVYRAARLAGVTGRVRNDASGVTIDAFGDAATLSRFIDALAMPPPAARIVRVDTIEIASEPTASFDIVHSDRGADRHVSIPPDLATCDSTWRCRDVRRVWMR